MRVSSVTGCCNSMNFYNLGGAHGHRTAKDQNEFEDWLAARGHESINIAITNSEQAKTREYLVNAGWKTEKVSSYLWISTISGNDFSKIQQRTWARQSEERKQALEKKRKLEAERLAMKASLKFSPGTALGVHQGKVLYTDISKICQGRAPYWHNQSGHKDTLESIKNSIKEKYFVDVGQIYYMSIEHLRDKVYKEIYKARKNAGIL